MIELACTLFVLWIVYKVLCVVLGLTVLSVMTIKETFNDDVVAPTMQREAFVWCKNDVVVVISAVVLTVLVCGSKVVYGW